MKEPMWTFQFESKERDQYKYDELFASDALLLGRVTYEGFAQAWPTMEGTGDYGERMNSLPKYVATTTLDDLAWNATPIKGDLMAAVNDLKQQDGQDILVFGSGKFVQSLIKHGLVDEYRLMIFPIVLGMGQRLFPEGIGETKLHLTDTTTFPPGVAVLTYEPNREREQ